MRAKHRNRRLAAAIAADDRPQYKIAADAEIDPNTLSGITSGRRQPSPEQCARIADTLGVDIADLFDDIEVAS